jgi:excisionase family DNA binding protein
MSEHSSTIKNAIKKFESPNGSRLLTIKEAAKHLGLTTWAMRERIWAGHIPIVKFPGGRKAYIDFLDIDPFINQNKCLIE